VVSPAPDSSSTYLPKSARQKPGNPRATLLQWVLPILVFVAVYEFFANPSGPRPATEPSASAPGWIRLVEWLVPAVAVGWAAVWIHAIRAFKKVVERAGALKRQGAFDEAEALLRGEQRRRWWAGAIRTSLGTHLGALAVERGDLDAAVPLLLASRRRFGAWARTIRYAAAENLVMCHILRGDPSSAEHWLAVLQREAKPTTGPQAFFLFEVLIALRRREHEHAQVMIRERWRELEAAVPVAALREYRILEAFALAQQGVREAGKAEAIIAEIKEAGNPPECFAHYRKAWPEMALFLEVNGL
jgi:hypothetical protein